MQSKKPIQNTVHTYFFFNDTATTEIYTLSLHDALPICPPDRYSDPPPRCRRPSPPRPVASTQDRKSTRLNSSHVRISYAVFCLKKKKVMMQYCYTSPFD